MVTEASMELLGNVSSYALGSVVSDMRSIFICLLLGATIKALVLFLFDNRTSHSTGVSQGRRLQKCCRNR
jgi:hypothetical protein